MKNLLLLFLLASCATPIRKVSLPPVTPPVVVRPIPAPVMVKKEIKTIMFSIPADATAEFREAVELISHWSNSDEFWEYVKGKRKYFSHAWNISVENCIKAFRASLSKGELVEIKFYVPDYERTIGAWDGEFIYENKNLEFPAVERAGHLLHEITHKYGWVHKGNKIGWWDNVSSFPYAIGYDFRAFLQTKYQQLADQ